MSTQPVPGSSREPAAACAIALLMLVVSATPGRAQPSGGPADLWRRSREGMRTPLHRFNNDMVFVDGEFLQSAGWEGGLDAHTYYIDYDAGQVYVGTDPANHLVEITAFDSALVRTTGERGDKRRMVE
jgi:hypothetical protein